MNASNGVVAVKAKYPKGWAVKTQDTPNGISVYESTNPEEKGSCFFYVIKDESGLDVDDIYGEIKSCIDRNMELIEKAKIYKQKSDELKKLIVELPLKKASWITFTVRKPKAKMDVQTVEGDTTGNTAKNSEMNGGDGDK